MARAQSAQSARTRYTRAAQGVLVVLPQAQQKHRGCHARMHASATQASWAPSIRGPHAHNVTRASSRKFGFQSVKHVLKTPVLQHRAHHLRPVHATRDTPGTTLSGPITGISCPERAAHAPPIHSAAVVWPARPVQLTEPGRPLALMRRDALATLGTQPQTAARALRAGWTRSGTVTARRRARHAPRTRARRKRARQPRPASATPGSMALTVARARHAALARTRPLWAAQPVMIVPAALHRRRRARK